MIVKDEHGKQEDLEFDPVNFGQALSVIADSVSCYVTSFVNSKPDLDDEDKKKMSQGAIAIFLNDLLMRAKHKEEMANILDIISAELRSATEEERNAEK
jgi:hypothetical protein